MVCEYKRLAAKSAVFSKGDFLEALHIIECFCTHTQKFIIINLGVIHVIYSTKRNQSPSFAFGTSTFRFFSHSHQHK